MTKYKTGGKVDFDPKSFDSLILLGGHNVGQF